MGTISGDFGTKFNLTYPMAPFNRTNSTNPGINVSQSSGVDHGADGGNPAILAGILIPHLVCTVFVAARCWSRLVLLRKWFLDDSLIVAAWAFSTGIAVVYSIASVSPGIGRAVALTSGGVADVGLIDYDHEAVRPYMLRTYLGLIFYQLCLCLTKLSILTFYLRMFVTRPLLRRLAWGTVIVVFIYGTPLLFMSVFQCHPVAGQFFGTPMKCFAFTPLLIASASLHTVTDAWLIVMVIPCVVRLDLPPRQKVALAVVLSLSVFVIAASLTRLQLSLHANYRPGGAGVQIANTLGFFVMTMLECDIALLCASAPTLRPLLARLWPKMGLGESAGTGGLGRRPSRLRHRVGGSDGEDVDSVNLTTVSYHGYPWTEPTTPGARSKAASMANVAAPTLPFPAPPLPAYHRTPTTLSLRSFMSSIAAGASPRSRGLTGTSATDPDRAGLLLHDAAAAESRRSSVGFEGYHDQYLGYGDREELQRRRQTRSRSASKLSTLSLGGPRVGRWGNSSQESFVLGLNDPASPRLSPVASGFSGTTVVRTETLDSRADLDGMLGEKGDGEAKGDAALEKTATEDEVNKDDVAHTDADADATRGGKESS